MTVATIFAGTNDGQMRCNNATYLTARSGGGTFTVDTTNTDQLSGQELFSGQYYCYEYALDFDTSAIPANAIISSAVLSLAAGTKGDGTTSAIHRARLSDWGATLTSADWVPGASLAALPLLAHIAQTAVATSGYNALTDDAMAANIVKGGNTRMLMVTDRMEAATVPTTTEFVRWRTSDTAGTTSDPKLVITYTVPAGSSQAVVVA